MNLYFKEIAETIFNNILNNENALCILGDIVNDATRKTDYHPNECVMPLKDLALLGAMIVAARQDETMNKWLEDTEEEDNDDPCKLEANERLGDLYQECYITNKDKEIIDTVYREVTCADKESMLIQLW